MLDSQIIFREYIQHHEMRGLIKTVNPELESTSFVDKEAQISKIVFKAVRDALSQEVVKVLEELEKQLTTILGCIKSRDSEQHTQRSAIYLPEKAYYEIKRDVKQLFVYLQRVLIINVTQNLCKRLTKNLDELTNAIMQGDTGRPKLKNKKIDYEKRTTDLSEEMPEDQARMDKSTEDQYGTNDSLGNLSERIKRLLEMTHNATDLLEYLSEKFLDMREENRKLKETH
jgi:uncharacterized phage infection (PIP) family protein YhgE